MVSTTDSYTCGRWFDSYPGHVFFSSSVVFIFSFVFGALRPSQQIFSHVGTISCFHELNQPWVAKVTPPAVSLELASLRSPDKRSSVFFSYFNGTVECADVLFVCLI